MSVKQWLWAGALLAALGACDDVPELKPYAKTTAGNTILRGEDFCVLQKKSGDDLMAMVLSDDRKDRLITFSAPSDMPIPHANGEANFHLLFYAIGNQPEDFTPEKMTFRKEGMTQFFTVTATDKLLFFLSMSHGVALTFESTVVGKFAQKQDFKDDLDALAKCAGMTFDEMAGLKPFTPRK